jgi:hypothetical protein
MNKLKIDNKPHGHIYKESFTRYTPWKEKYNCSTNYRNYICMLSVNDLPFIFKLDHFIVNKFLLDKEPVTYQCLEEWYDYKLKNKPTINNDAYCQVLKKYSKISLCN